MAPLKTYQRLEARLVREAAPEPYNRRIGGVADVLLIARVLQDADREKFLALHLDEKHKLICVDLVSVGTINSALVHPREVFKTALLSNASAMILVHNHPSGETQPSHEDVSLTRRLSDAGKIMGIHILDHVVVGPGEGYTGLAESGLMPA